MKPMNNVSVRLGYSVVWETCMLQLFFCPDKYHTRDHHILWGCQGRPCNLGSLRVYLSLGCQAVVRAVHKGDRDRERERRLVH